MTNADNSLDSILIQLGDFGKYQAIIFGLVCIGVILHSGVHVAFVFTAMDMEYRCEVPECDGPKPEFEPPWLRTAVPYTDGVPEKCLRYVLASTTENPGNCSEATNHTLRTERCNSFVYRTEERSILQEYDLQCSDNLWKLTLVGTINNVGQFFGTFVSGVIGDRYGRRAIFILGLIFCGICGLVRTVAPSYAWFVVLEFLDAFFGAGSYICGFIIGVELVGPKKRVLTGTLISSCYTVGEVLAAGSAWFFKAWRPVIYVLYAPPMLLFFYFRIIPESIRWNLSKGRVEEVKKVLRKAAKINKKVISEQSLQKLTEGDETSAVSIFMVLKSTKLLLRLLNCIFCWITCAFLFYGLTLNAVSLAGNAYLDFILTAVVEIPAYIACTQIVDKIGRRWSLSGSFFITGISCLVFMFVPSDMHALSLALWLLGKFGSTAAFTITYVITSELFPTPLRHSTMGGCSTLGRIGSMISPQTPLLAQIWNPLPIALFAAMAITAGLLTFLFPETVNLKLPDTIEEAVNIGQNKDSHKKETCNPMMLCNAQ